MGNLTDTVSRLIEAVETAKNGLAPILEQLKDPSIPLDERWKAYTDLVKAGVLDNNEIYGDGFVDTLGENLTLYDDFYVERHETRDFIDMYDHIMESDGDYQKELVAARETNLAAWQEEVLASGYSSFTYDW
jgi:hypothetical protein